MPKAKELKSAPVAGPQVFCSHTEIVELGKIIPNPRNPNTHPAKQVELLAKIIAAQGWRAPITVSKRSGFIVRGHARYAAAVKLGLTEAPVDYQDYASEAAEWADMIADNRLAELAVIDRAALKDLLGEMDNGAFDMDLTGFDDGAMEQLMTAVASEEPVEGAPQNMVVQYSIIFDDESQQTRWYEFLKVLKLKHPDAETIAQRLDAHISTVLANGHDKG